jgi:lipoate---protein ligase
VARPRPGILDIMTTYAVETSAGTVAEFHGRDIGDDPAPAVWVFDVTAPALVLGSKQRDAGIADAAACAAAGVEVVRRRSGGGAVLLEPGGVVWFDVVVPSAQLHAAGVGDDVTASMTWLGWHVATALADLAVPADVHRGAMSCTAWCPLICFAGVGPGEVVSDGGKLVGISQRRSRAGARFQCAVHTRWSPSTLVGLLTTAVAVDELPPVATLPPVVAADLPSVVAAALTAS